MVDRISSVFKKIFLKIRYGKRITIGRRVIFRKGVFINIRKQGRLSIGNNVFFNRYCSVNCHNNISIDDDNIFGEFVTIYDHDHVFNKKDLRRSAFLEGSVSIGKANWFGTKCTILRNTSVGLNNVFGACLLIKGDYSNCTLYKHKIDDFYSEAIVFDSEE